MFKWSAFPFIRLSVVLALGVMLSQYFGDIHFRTLHAIGVLTFLVILCVLSLKVLLLRGVALMLAMCAIGYALGYLNVDSRSIDHYSHFTEVDGFVGVVVTDHTTRTNYLRYDLELKKLQLQGQQVRTTGKIFLYVKKDDQPPLKYGDVVAVTKGYFGISPPKNPNEFDYKRYLKRQNIYAHAFVSSQDIRLIDHLALNVLKSWAYSARAKAQDLFDEMIKAPRERAIISALLLGIKDYLDNELKNAYSSAGAIHVLAVSGLHVGIIFTFLKMLFNPWRDRRFGRYIFMAVGVVSLWMYALITGFSPSVMRAATMFSVVIVSEAFYKNSNIYNSLGFAAFLLILLDPFVLYAVGFQLSFAAVLGILMVYPLIHRRVHFHSKFGTYAWSIVCVSIAAQLATFPLTLYYFNQFPTYFLVSNLIVIPAVSCMLYGGLVVLFFGLLMPQVGEVLSFIYELFVYGLNEIVLFLRVLPYPLLDWVYFDELDVVLVYLILMVIYLTVTTYQYDFIKLGVSLCVLFSGWLFWKDWVGRDVEQVLFYEVDELVAIDVVTGKEAVLLVDTFPEHIRKETYYQIDPYRLAHGLPKTRNTWELMFQSEWGRQVRTINVLDLQGLSVVVVGDLSDWSVAEALSVDVLFLKEGSKNFHKLFQCDLVVMGNGLDYHEREQVIKTCEENGLRYHSLRADGYLALDLNELDFPIE